jgi:hypothetical protein
MLMLMTVLVAGAAMAPPARVEKPVVLPCPTVEVQKAGERRAPRKPIFSARQVGDLEFVLTYSHRLTGRRIELKLLTPSGHLYQTLTQTLGPPRHRHPSGQTSLRLPVSGTLIEHSSLFGNWRADTFIDGSPSACRHPLRFTLTR